MNKQKLLKKLKISNILCIIVFILVLLDIIFLSKIGIIFLLIVGIINSQSRYFKYKNEINNGEPNLNRKINIYIFIVSTVIFCLLILNLVYILD